MSLRYGLLGLLKYSPMTGYDLKKIFEDSVNYFWSAKTSQIYRELQTLEKNKCVKSNIEINKAGPNRHVYTITPLGIKLLKEWLTNMPEETDEDNRNEFLMRVFLSSNIGGNELLRLLEARLKKYQSDIKRLDATAKALPKYKEKFDVDKELLYWKISVSRGYHDVQSHIQWAEESIQYLKELGFK